MIEKIANWCRSILHSEELFTICMFFCMVVLFAMFIRWLLWALFVVIGIIS